MPFYFLLLVISFVGVLSVVALALAIVTVLVLDVLKFAGVLLVAKASGARVKDLY